MSGNPFVIGDRLVVNQRAVREVGRRNDHTSRTLAVGATGYIVVPDALLKSVYGFDGDWRLRENREELRKLRLHLRDVAPEIIYDLLRRSRDVFGIGLERGTVSGGIGEALPFGDDHHLHLDPSDLAETELM